MNNSEGRDTKTLSEWWDDWWNRHLSFHSLPLHPHQLQVMHMQFVHIGLHRHLIDKVLPHLRAGRARRVLMPGNGFWWGPHALVHLGFDVTVVDVSPLANASLAAASPTPEQMCLFFPVYRREMMDGRLTSVPNKEASLRRFADEAVAGGRLTIMTADINKYEPEQGFDAILDDRLMQVLPSYQWAGMAQKYANWVGEGFCFVHTMNVTVRDKFEAAFQDAGFYNGYAPNVTYPQQGPTVFLHYASG